MSDQNTSAPEAQQTPTQTPQQEAQLPQTPDLPQGEPGAIPPLAPPPGQPLAPASGPAPRKLSRFLLVSIILLAALTVASIALLFVGDFEGRFERVFSTFTLFAIFVVFTAFDTRRDQSTDWYAPVALLANAYILGLGLIVIWVTAYHPFDLMWEIMWKSLLVILVTRASILACQLLLKAANVQPESVGRFAFVTSVLAVLSGVLYTAPAGIDAFGLHVPDLYWRIATALLILTGLALSITLLLRWYYTADERAERAERRRAAIPAPYAAGAPEPDAPTAAAPAPAPPAPPASQGLLPWPTFPDGRPYPAGADGQPDFLAAQQQ